MRTHLILLSLSYPTLILSTSSYKTWWYVKGTFAKTFMVFTVDILAPKDSERMGFEWRALLHYCAPVDDGTAHTEV